MASKHKPEKIFGGITCAAFKKLLTEEVNEVKKSGEKLLIMYFGHGARTIDGEAPDVVWHFGRREGDQLDLGAFLNAIGTKKGEGPQIMVVSTACYSGGWLYSPDFNMSAMMAAGLWAQKSFLAVFRIFRSLFWIYAGYWCCRAAGK